MRRLRLSPILAALSVLGVVASMLVAAPASAQDNDPVLVVDPQATITFTGSGWGHGVGMSQWGAYSRTQAGHSASDILDFYYEGTNLVENYGRASAAPTPSPTPAPTPIATPLPTPAPDSAGDPTYVLLATATTTTLTPEGLNRITVDDTNIAHNGQDATRVLAGTPITVTRAANRWHITYSNINICPTGCEGASVQLHFATNTAVNVSNTRRSYSHGRINIIPAGQNPNQFHITLDSLSTEKYLTDPHNAPATAQAPPSDAKDSVQVLLATSGSTTLTPEGINRITIDNADFAHNGQDTARVPPGTPLTVARLGNRWALTYGGISICPNGCEGSSVQLHFATNTAVAVSNTGRSYSHGRINIVANNHNPTLFHVTLDSLSVERFFNDPHNDIFGTIHPEASDPIEPTPGLDPPAPPVNPEDSIRVLLSTATGTTLTPEGVNRITIDGQGGIQVPAGTPVAITRHSDHWHIIYGGTDACGVGCYGSTVQLHFASGTSVSVSNTGHSYAHGRINLVPTGTSREFHVILDSLSIENYLRGIAETPMNWPLTAHEAQAIAARSYAFATLLERRASSSWNRPFDLYSTVWDQAFVGDTREKHADAPTWLQAVTNTAGQVLVYEGTPIRAFYSSSNGGHTELSSYVFYADLPYLPAKPDPFDIQHSPHATWERVYNVGDFNQWLNDHSDTSVGRLQGIEITGGTGASGRVDEANIQITGTSRTITVTGSRLQSRINTAASEQGRGQLLSTKFVFDISDEALIPETTSEETTGETPRDDALFFSGMIDGPDFCFNRSLGGPTTYPFDSNGDGVADACALPRTRREAAARQQALEDLVLLPGLRDSFVAFFAEECLSVPETLGEPDNEPADECQQYRTRSANAPADTDAPPKPISITPTPPNGDDPYPNGVGDDLYYSGIIDGPDFCFNRSLGGPTTYPFDSNGDGVADACALPRTRREAAARQQALERLALEYPSEFNILFQLACVKGPNTLGEPEDEAVDQCQQYRGPSAGG